MSKQYWQDFYSKHDIKGHTPFAEWCLPYMWNHTYVADLGCGNGRDTYYFAKNYKRVIGIDYAVRPKNSEGALFEQIHINDVIEKPCFYDVVYSRFFLHSIPYSQVANLLRWTRGLFIAEFRAKGDEPKLYPNHPRNFIDGNSFLKDLDRFGFDIIHYEKGRGLAKYKGEDPLIIRVVAKKEK